MVEPAHNPTPPPRFRFRSAERLAQLLEVRRAPRFLIPLLFLLDLILVIGLSDVVASVPALHWLVDINPVIPADLTFNLLILTLEVCALLVFIRLRPNEIRRDRWQFAKGLLFGLACFNTVLFVLLGVSWLTNSGDTLAAFVAPDSVSRWLTYTVGVALSEEVLYRWFFLGQFFQHLRIKDTRQRLAVALIGSQILFALIHLPTRLDVWGTSLERLPFEMFGLFAFGVMYGLIYLQTGSLFAAIIAHALVDIVIETSGNNALPRLTLTIAILVFTALWPFIARGQFKPRPQPPLAET